MGLLLVALLVGVASAATTDRPIVGIVTQASEYGFPNQGESYIAASYVKFVEASGARVVPGSSSLRARDRWRR
jgi:hypothetical protein